MQMRIKSTYPAFAFLPCLFVAYAWLVYFEVNIAGPVVVLFFLGTAIMVIYASTLAYIVDANPGRSTSAVACNSLFRGVLAVRLSSLTFSIPLSRALTYPSCTTGLRARSAPRARPPSPSSTRSRTAPSTRVRALPLLVWFSQLLMPVHLAGWGVLLLLGEGALVVVAIRGGKWRAASRASEARDAERRKERDEKRLGRIGSGEKQ